MNAIKKETMLGNIAAVLILTGMTLFSELMGNSEIIFPEIAALTIGALLSPKLAWRTSAGEMVILIAICSCFGLGMVVFMPGSVPLKMVLTYAFCQLILLLRGTTFAPMISAALLPILVNTESVIYPVSAITFTALTVLVMLWKNHIFRKEADAEPEEETDIERSMRRRIFSGLKNPLWKQEAVAAVLRIAAAGILIAIAFFVPLYMPMRFCVAPPLLVLFTEMSRSASPARKHPVKVGLLVFGCALTGVLSRMVLCGGFSLPLWTAALLAAVLMIIYRRISGLSLPPSGALLMLPMLISADQLFTYPLQIGIGTVLVILAALVFPKLEHLADRLIFR